MTHSCREEFSPIGIKDSATRHSLCAPAFGGSKHYTRTGIFTCSTGIRSGPGCQESPSLRKGRKDCVLPTNRTSFAQSCSSSMVVSGWIRRYSAHRSSTNGCRRPAEAACSSFVILAPIDWFPIGLSRADRGMTRLKPFTGGFAITGTANGQAESRRSPENWNIGLEG